MSFVVYSGLKDAKVYPQSEEVFPGCQLGEVLFEELGIDVPLDSMVLFEPAVTADVERTSTHELGRHLGRLFASGHVQSTSVWARSPASTIESFGGLGGEVVECVVRQGEPNRRVRHLTLV